jgi:hypothetical protein
MLATLLKAVQERGQIDQTLDADLAAAILLGTLEGVGKMTIRDPDHDMKNELDMLTTLIKRFLAPGSSK